MPARGSRSGARERTKRKVELDIKPTESEKDISLAVIRLFHDWVAESVHRHDLAGFFQSLARKLHEVFGARLVTIWDNNHRNDCLVLQSSVPARRDVLAAHTVAAETSLTGAAVKSRGLERFPDILEPREDGRYFASPTLAADLGLKSMLSIPVASPVQGNVVGLVINLCFGAEPGEGNFIPDEDITRLVSDLSIYVQYLVSRRDEKIMDDVRVAAASAKGILPLFDAVREALHDATGCTQSALFRWDDGQCDFYREAPADLMLDASGKTTRWLSKSCEYEEPFDRRLIPDCVMHRLPLVVRADAPGGGLAGEVQCTYMAVPILSSSDEVVGVLRCRNPRGGEGKAPSFSSFDLLALQTFSRALAPSVERFLRLREGSGLMRIVTDVSRAMSRAYELDTSLQHMIETLVGAMHSEIGSIYLRREEDDLFYMHAATEPIKHLVGQARYKEGEGVTGTIAAGELLNFRTRGELRAYPGRAGKYHAQVYGAGSERDSDTLLGVPIRAGGRVIGLWKIENVRPSDAHPDPYFTDEDVQMAEVLSCFLEYAIQNHRQEQARLRQFIQLAATSVRIERAPDEQSAIDVVLKAIGDAGFPGALLSLYDARTRRLADGKPSGSTWTKANILTCHISDDDVRAIALKTGQEEFVADSSADSRCRNNPLRDGLKAQYVLPLRLGDELIGTLQVDMGPSPHPKDLDLLTLRAFAGHLAIAISRRRSIQQTLDLTNNVLQSSRFITAEALSATAVHSLHHKLVDINRQLKKDLDRQDIRNREFIYKTLDRWRGKLDDLEKHLKAALGLVRAPLDEARSHEVDLHPEVQNAISTWIHFIHENGGTVRTDLRAEQSVCVMAAEAFREIMAVLLVNAAQAQARRIDIKSYNGVDIQTANDKRIKAAFCLECADNGNGLATTDYEKLFEATYTTKQKNNGTGLGLFIARRLARNSGGELEVVVRKDYSKGVTFRLCLPLARSGKQKGRGD